MSMGCAYCWLDVSRLLHFFWLVLLAIILPNNVVWCVLWLPAPTPPPFFDPLNPSAPLCTHLLLFLLIWEKKGYLTAIIYKVKANRYIVDMTINQATASLNSIEYFKWYFLKYYYVLGWFSLRQSHICKSFKLCVCYVQVTWISVCPSLKWLYLYL